MTQLRDRFQELDDLKYIYLRKLLDSEIYPELREYLEGIDDIEELYHTNTPESRKKAEAIIDEILKKIMNGIEALFYNDKGIIDKLEKKEEITKNDLDCQLKKVEIFNLWAERQAKLYFHLMEVFHKQEEGKRLAQDYQEAWSNPQRMIELKKWERLALNSWKRREEKENK